MRGSSQTPVWLRIVGVVAVAWNALGAWSYLGYVGMVPAMEPAAGPPMPAIITAAYATSAFVGVAGSIGLVLAKRWALPLFVVSLVAVIINWGWVFTNGAASEMGLGITVVTGAVVLAALTGFAARKGWLR